MDGCSNGRYNKYIRRVIFSSYSIVLDIGMQSYTVLMVRVCAAVTSVEFIIVTFYHHSAYEHKCTVAYNGKCENHIFPFFLTQHPFSFGYWQPT